jgi:large subunit ribosomal protein L14e
MREISPASGVVVISKAGRDAGGCFVILSVADDQYVWMADGERRKVLKPKKKKIKHLDIRPFVAQEIRRKLMEGETLLDSDLRRAIAVFRTAQQKEEG